MGNQPPAPPPRFEGEKTTKIVIYFQNSKETSGKICTSSPHPATSSASGTTSNKIPCLLP